jgi:predicted dehydrogenase
MDPKLYNYRNLNELVRWRLYDRTGGGLMAELGSHQLDACSIFVNACGDFTEKPKPVSVTGMGGKHFFNDDRECEDHVYCMFEFPGKGYQPKRDPRDNDTVVVTYSSINTNAMEGYGEVVMGTRGTLQVMQERDVLLFEENDPYKSAREDTRRKYLEKQRLTGGVKPVDVRVSTASKGETTMYSAASLGLAALSSPHPFGPTLAWRLMPWKRGKTFSAKS